MLTVCTRCATVFLRGAPDCSSSMENTSSIWDTMPPEFLIDSSVPPCTKNQAVHSVRHPPLSPFSSYAVASEDAVSPGSYTGSNTARYDLGLRQGYYQYNADSGSTTAYYFIS